MIYMNDEKKKDVDNKIVVNLVTNYECLYVLIWITTNYTIKVFLCLSVPKLLSNSHYEDKVIFDNPYLCSSI